MKRLLLFIGFLTGCQFASAQYNFYRLSVGGGYGVNRPFTDIDKSKILHSFCGNFDYYITPFFSAGIEVQKGGLSAGDSIQDPHKRYFKNAYTAYTVGARLELAKLIHLRYNTNVLLSAAKGLYGGIGFGLISNNQTEIVRSKRNPDGRLYFFPGKDKSVELIIPANIGYNVKIPNRWDYPQFVFYINHQFNVNIGGNIDGYNDPRSKFKNVAPDMYSLTSIGIRYSFGPEGLY